MTLDSIKVLISDDSILARKKLKDMLASFGLTNILETSDGQDAIDIYIAEKPELVFLDIVMPKKDGILAIAEIMEFDSSAYIIMVSSIGTQKYLKEALSEGAKDFIQKPLDSDQLANIVKRFVERS